MNPKNLLLLCAMLSTSAVLASETSTESPKSAADSPQVSPSSSEDSSGEKDKAPTKGKVFTEASRGFFGRMLDARRERRVEGLEPPSKIREPKSEDVAVIEDAFNAFSPQKLQAIHAINMDMLEKYDPRTSVSWAYHLVLNGGLDEIKAAGLIGVLKSILLERKELAYTLIGRFRAQKKKVSDLYTAIRMGKSNDLAGYNKAYELLHDCAVDLAKAQETNAKIKVIMSHLD